LIINCIRVLPNSVISTQKNRTWIELPFQIFYFLQLTVAEFFWFLAGLQKIAGCHAVGYSKQPESKKPYRISTQTTDIVIDKYNTRIKDCEKEYRRNTRRQKRRP